MIRAFVPVRGGSKSIPKKNIKDFCGQPLVYWTLKALQDAEAVDEIILATDSEEITSVVANLHLSKVRCYDRDPENANDTASTEAVMLEYIASRKDLATDDLFILAQATSPFTTAVDVSQALADFKNSDADSMLTCARMKRFYWADNGTPINYNYVQRPRRQDFNGTLMENGAFYINSIGNILRDKNRLSGKIATYEMAEFTGVEIDEEDDWVISEKLMRKYILGSSHPSPIKMFFSDVDGTLTDAGMYYSESGDELKKFNTRDGKGFELLRNRGVITGIITSEKTKLVERRAKKLKVDYLYQGEEHCGKLEKVQAVCQEHGISLNEVAYIGDDINCKELLEHVGHAACPADAHDTVQSIPGIVHLQSKGGEGAVREFVDRLLSTQQENQA